MKLLIKFAIAVGVILGLWTASRAMPAGAEALNPPSLQFPWGENEQHRITGSGYNCDTHTRAWDRFGLDFDFTAGTSVRAVSAGRATIRLDDEGGNVVDIDHGSGFVSTYAHLSSFSVTTGTW